MKILFIVTSFNSLSQKVYVELKNFNYEIYVEIFINDDYVKNKNFNFLDIDKKGISRPLMTQNYRKVNFNIDDTNKIFKIINMSDSQPGVLINLKHIYNKNTNMNIFILNNNLDEINDYYMYGFG